MKKGLLIGGLSLGLWSTALAQNVGIGTNSPSSKLTIVDNSGNSVKVLVEGDNTARHMELALLNTDLGGGLSLGVANALPTYGDAGETYVYSSARAQGLNIINNNTTGRGHIAFYAAGVHSTGDAAFYIANNRFVGVGTESPTHDLHVEGFARVTRLAGTGNGMVFTDATGVLFRNNLSGNANDVLDGQGNFVPASSFSNAWDLTGNAGTNAGTNFLGTTDAQNLQLRTDNALRMDIKSDGAVWLANSTATYLRSGASGGARILGEQGHTPARPAIGFFSVNGVDDGSGGNGIYRPSANTMAFATASLERMRISSGGGVVIAGTSAFGKLTVNSEETETNIYNINEGTSGGVKYGVLNVMQTTSNSANYGIRNNFTTTSTNEKYGMYNDFADVNGNKYGVYNNFPNGNAIGTIIGTYNNVQNDGTATKYGTQNRVQGGSGTLYGSENIVTPASTSTGTAYGVRGIVSNTGTGVHYGGYFDATGNNNRAVYARNTTASGWAGYFEGNAYVANNLGVGTNAPAEKLEVLGARVLIRNGSDAMYCSRHTASGFSFELIGSYPGWDTRGIYLGGYNVNNTGTSTYTAANKVYCGGTFGSLPIHATAFNVASSADFKKNVSTLTYGLKEILQIRPVTYQYNFEKSGLYSVGFIAEEVSAIIPELVAHHDEDDNVVSRENGKPVAMDYSKMTAVLVNAVQEQQAQIELLKAKIEVLEAANK